MTIVKKYKNLLIVIIIVFGFYSFSAWSQYTWSERFRKGVGSDWIVVDEQKNAADPIFPYTFFNPPINRLGLIQSSSVKALGNGVYQYNLMWADGIIGIRMPNEVFLSFADCTKQMKGNLRDSLKQMKNLDDIEWRSPDNNPYVTNIEDKERLIQVFQQTCNVLSRLNK